MAKVMVFTIKHIGQGALHVDPTPDIFFRILLLRHDKANLEMVWSSHTPKPLWFLYRSDSFTRKSFPLSMFEIGKILIYSNS